MDNIFFERRIKFDDTTGFYSATCTIIMPVGEAGYIQSEYLGDYILCNEPMRIRWGRYLKEKCGRVGYFTTSATTMRRINEDVECFETNALAQIRKNIDRRKENANE